MGRPGLLGLGLVVVAATAGCSGVGDLASCSSDAECGPAARCIDRLCVEVELPRIWISPERAEAAIGEEVAVTAVVEGEGADRLAFRVEPDGTATLVAEGLKAWVRPRIPHATVRVVASVRDPWGREVEAAAEIAVRNSSPELQLEVPPSFQPGERVELRAAVSDPDGDPIAVTWSLNAALGSLVADGERAFLSTVPGVEDFTYLVTAVARDGHGGERSESVVLQPRNEPPSIRFETSEAHHRCEGEPLSCSAAIPLEVEVEDAGPTTLQLRLVDPRPEVAHRFVEEEGRFRLELSCRPACPLAGPWRVEATATDALGASRSVVGEVRVLNRPPVLRAHDGSTLPHRAEPVPGGFRYVARRDPGTVLTWEDPDGDPPDLSSIRWSGTEGLVRFDDETALDPQVEIVADEPELLQEARLVFRAADINGAETLAEATVPIGNTPPHVSFGGDLRSGHEFAGAASDGTRYYRKAISLASLDLSDADGDPLVVTLELDPEDGEAQARGVRIYEEQGTWYLAGIGPEFLGRTYRVKVTAFDPFGEAASSVGEVLVSNRPPEVREVPPTLFLRGGACRMESCCAPLPGRDTCTTTTFLVATEWQGAPGPYQPAVEVVVHDPDGDPVRLDVDFWSETGKVRGQLLLNGAWKQKGSVDCQLSGGKVRCPLQLRFLAEGGTFPLVCAVESGTRPDTVMKVLVRANDGLDLSAEGYWIYHFDPDRSDGSCE